MSCYSLGPLYIITCVPVYSITANTSSLFEGDSVTFTITTQNVPDGTVLYYQLSGVSGTITDADFVESNLVSQPQSVVINGNTGSFTVTLANDSVIEGTEVFRSNLIASCEMSQVAFSPSISVNEIPVAELSSSFQLGTGGYNTFEYYHGEWKGDLLAVAHDLYGGTGYIGIYNPNLGRTQYYQSGGVVLNSSGVKQTDLVSTRYNSDTWDLDGRSVNWTNDFLMINYNFYRISDWYRYWNADFADDINSFGDDIDYRAASGGRNHNGFINGGRIGRARQKNSTTIELNDVYNGDWYDENYQGWKEAYPAGATHPTEPIAVAGRSGSFRWKNLSNTNTYTTVTLPTSYDGYTFTCNYMSFTKDGKFLIISADTGQSSSDETQDSSVFVYECSVSSGVATFTLRGNPQYDQVYTTQNYFDPRNALQISVGNRLVGYGFRMYDLSESGVLSLNQDLTDYFYGGTAEQEITGGSANITVRAGRQCVINDDDSKIAILVDNIYSPAYQGGIYIFDVN
jgi:hypothetical protein